MIWMEYMKKRRIKGNSIISELKDEVDCNRDGGATLGVADLED